MKFKNFVKKVKTIKLLFFNIYRNNLSEDLKKEIDLLAEETSFLFKEIRDELKELETIDDSTAIRKIEISLIDNAWCSICGTSGSFIHKQCVEVGCVDSKSIICVCPNCVKKMYQKIKEKK